MSQVNALMQQIEKQAASHKNDDRFAHVVQIGEIIRQGDIYIERVEESETRGKATKEVQLAPGTSKGSRHILRELGAGTVSVFESGISDPLAGPVVCATERFEVTHPEHPNFSIPSGTYKITYQRDYAMEERARVRD